MVKHTKNKARLDKFYHVAKEQGYRSRAAFKLIQLNKKYGFLQNATALIDLCAAPGGWMQVASKYMPGGSTIIGLDLDKIKPIPNCKAFVQDITTPQCLKLIKSELGGNKADVVLHDGAPNVGTSWNHDAYGQNELVLHSVALASKVLRKGGWFITKVFRSSDYNSLIWVFSKLFDKVEATKPEASRNTSAEIFVVCSGFKAPEIIDPRLFEAGNVFKNSTFDLITESGGVTSINKLLERKRNRGGYADDVPTGIYKKITLTEFVDCENPIPIFGDFHEISISPEELEKYGKLAKPPQDYEVACKDIQVLGKPEIMSLVKWRKKIVSKLEKVVKKDEGNELNEEVKEPVNELDSKIKLAEKIEKTIHSKREAKKEQLLTKKLAKATDLQDENEELFDIFKFKNFEKLGYIDEDNDNLMRNEKEVPKLYYNNLDEVEDNIEFLVNLKKEKKLKAKKIQDQREREKEELNQEEINYFVPEYKMRTHTARQEEYEGPKTVQLNNSKFFDTQDFKIMKSALNEFNNVSIKNPLAKDQNTDINTSSDESDNDVDELTENKKILLGKKRKSSELEDSKNSKSKKISKVEKPKSKFEEPIKKVKEDQEIEIAPRDNYEDMDIDELAETTALAKVMLRKRNRESIIDSTYNKYNFGENDNLPSWFLEDELKHNYPIVPITKEEFRYERERLMALNSRSSKKVMEAKFRKQRKLQGRIRKAKSKAEVILEQDGIDERVKLNEIRKMYRKEANKDKQEKKYVTVRRFNAGPARSSKTLKFVDKRLKKDKRAMKRVNEKSTLKKYKRR